MSGAPNTLRMLRLASLDPPKYGWTACGGVASMLEPTEMARRKDAKERFLTRQREAKAEARKASFAEAPPEKNNGINKDEAAGQHYTITEPPAKAAPPSAAPAAVPGAEGNDPNDTPPKEAGDNPLKQIAIQATNDEGILDIYTYRRGRVGEEPRDPATGELLCDVDPIDTTYGWEPPSGMVKVTVKFPLGDADEDDEDSDDEDTEGGEGKKGDAGNDDGGEGSPSSMELGARTARRASRGTGPVPGSESQAHTLPKRALVPYFVEVVKWDLSDPHTPSPEEYATNIATEFGLSFPQTMDLKESIERQLSSFLRMRPQYFAPVPLVDPYGGERPASHIGPPEMHVGPVGPHMSSGARPVVKRSGSSLSGASSRTSRSSRPAGAIKIDRGKIVVIPKEQVVQPGAGCSFAQEVLQRAKSKSSATVREAVGRGEAALEIIKNEVCHICHNRKELGLTFHCGRHSYCDFHCATRLSFRVSDYDKKNPTCLPIDYCPVCTLHCTCSKCKRRLENVADKMKAACKKQSCDVENVVMDNLMDLCNVKLANDRENKPKKDKPKKVKIEAPAGTKRGRSDGSIDDPYVPRPSTARSTRSSPVIEGSDARPKKKRKFEAAAPVPVLKVPPSDFPKELWVEEDLDPSTPEDLNKVYTPDGTFPAPAAEPVEQKYQEKREIAAGLTHFHFCAVCELDNGDERICCSKCPRSYHKKCLEEDSSAEADAAGTPKRECKRCGWDQAVREAQDEIPRLMVPDDKIKASYATYKEDCDSHAFMSNVMSELLHILAKLVEYDYGFVFAAPVNLDEVMDYLNIISKPMDYGTITNKLENGGYTPSGEVGMDAMEEIVFHALMDIVQVHHNCFLYNAPGSLYYRAGEVQQRKWNAYYDKYLQGHLPESVRDSLASFVEKREAERRETVRSRRFQASANPKTNKGKAVAVFDPDTKMIIKQYSSKASARVAAIMLRDAGYDCEWDLTANSAKTRVENAEDPSKPLFGYQWIATEKLKSGDFTTRPFFRDDDLASPNPNNIVILKEDALTGNKIRGFSSLESAYEDFKCEKATKSLSLEEDAEPERLSVFVKEYLDADKSIGGVAYNRVEQPPEKEVVADAPMSPQGKVEGKCVMEEEHVPSPKKSDDASALLIPPKEVVADAPMSPQKKAVMDEEKGEDGSSQ